MLDLRYPIGYFFIINALLLTVDGLWLQPQTVYWAGHQVNLDVCWGSVMAVFGVVMIRLAVREKPAK